jgi:hypothetical protein
VKLIATGLLAGTLPRVYNTGGVRVGLLPPVRSEAEAFDDEVPHQLLMLGQDALLAHVVTPSLRARSVSVMARARPAFLSGVVTGRIVRPKLGKPRRADWTARVVAALVGMRSPSIHLS